MIFNDLTDLIGLTGLAGLSETPITLFLIITLTIIFLINPSNFIDCENVDSTKQNIIQSFIHTNLGHLLINLYSLYSLIYLERSLGSTRYLFLITVVLVLSSFIQAILTRLGNMGYWIFPTCSIGFSAVLLGLVIFDKLNKNNWVIDGEQLQQMLLILILPVIRNPRVSLTGHFSGILSGVSLGLLSGMFGLEF